jgi:hypothetical protein
VRKLVRNNEELRNTREEQLTMLFELNNKIIIIFEKAKREAIQLNELKREIELKKQENIRKNDDNKTDSENIARLESETKLLVGKNDRLQANLTQLQEQDIESQERIAKLEEDLQNNKDEIELIETTTQTQISKCRHEAEDFIRQTQRWLNQLNDEMLELNNLL